MKYKLLTENAFKYRSNSPFINKLIADFFLDKSTYPEYSLVENIREELSHSKKEIIVNDLGVGSVKMKSKQRKIRDIIRYSVKSRKYAQLLFRIVHYFKPASVIELGTSVGITASYLALGNWQAQLYTIEGCSETANIAGKIFSSLNIVNVKLYTGSFEEQLPAVLKTIPAADFIFFDGNHRKTPTLEYFEQCLEKITEQSIFVFDDIHCSSEMEQAWFEISNNAKVTLSIDIFAMGIIFFNRSLKKQVVRVNF
ncbi:MAG: class I SAM-dependent methyltransferase [Bacteroidia bacterium]|nr:class I SAM-dependent methyltransferase [Bacteroidia bacterium]